MKSGNLNLLEPSGPPQSCNGIALLFTPVLTDRYCHFLVVRLWYGAWLTQTSAYTRVIGESKRVYLLHHEMQNLPNS